MRSLWGIIYMLLTDNRTSRENEKWGIRQRWLWLWDIIGIRMAYRSIIKLKASSGIRYETDEQKISLATQDYGNVLKWLLRSDTSIGLWVLHRTETGIRLSLSATPGEFTRQEQVMMLKQVLERTEEGKDSVQHKGEWQNLPS